MKILFDYEIFSLQKYGGISRYFYELMNQFYQDHDIEIVFPLYFSHNQYIQKTPFSNHITFFPNIRFGLRNNVIKYLNRINHRQCIKTISLQNYDGFHPTFYSPYFLHLIKQKPFVITIHDMIHEIFPEYFSSNDKVSSNKKLLAEKSTKIIAVSENTKKDIIKFYGIPDDKISVIHHGCSFNKKSDESKLKLNNLPKKYLLFVGKRSLYKNFISFIKSIITLIHGFDDLHVVCAGGGKFTEEEIAVFRQNNINNRLHYYFITDSILANLYKNAIALVFPSIYEGFGMPILEAFFFGCPVALSNLSSFPEVAGKAGLYFNPFEKASIKDAVLKVIQDDKLRDDLKKEGYKQLEKYSWEKTAKATKKLYHGIF
ncbi:MAG: glycosyltransferase family 4 protein [Bacteroidetes bacterium]|nr:glycosyltransferase family 4 protein [Bacteroidota bacterium]